MELLDVLHLLGEEVEEGLSVIHWDKCIDQLVPYQLWNVNLLKCTATHSGLHILQGGCRFLANFSDLFEALKDRHGGLRCDLRCCLYSNNHIT